MFGGFHFPEFQFNLNEIRLPYTIMPIISNFNRFSCIYSGSYPHLMMAYMLLMVGLPFISCTPVVMLIYGAHQPNYVSDQAVVRYAHRLGLVHEIYRIKNYSEENRKHYGYLGNAIPALLLFNSAGNLTKYEIDCSASLDSIAKLSTHDIDGLPHAGKTLEDFRDDTYVVNNGNSEKPAFIHKPLYVVNFAEFAGLLNKQSVPELVAQLEQRDDVEYVILNIDYTVKK
jgi:hypothetical protein